MGLEMRSGEPLPDGLRRVFLEQLDAALADLQPGQSGTAAKAVHESRKRLKELRAALRLVRSAFADGEFQQENHALRDLGRPLSDARDAEAMIEALASLKEHFADELAADAFAAVRKALVARRRRVAKRVLEGDAALQTAAEGVTAARQRVMDWPLAKVDWETAAAGLKRVYRQGRAAMETALAGDADDASLHEWRKRVKDLRFQLTILQPLWPELMCVTASAAHTLGGYLGDDHDLAVLADLLRGELHELVPKADRQALVALIGRRRQSLQKNAKQLGKRLYAEGPGDFVRRLTRYWDADG